MNKLILLGLLITALTALISAGCLDTENAVKIDLHENTTTDIMFPVDEDTVQIAVASIISPEESVGYYQELFDYVSEKLKRPVKLVQRKTYFEVNELLRLKRVDAAFICSRAYVEGNDQFGLELLVAPVVSNKTVYYSYVIVPRDSDINSFEELRGKSYAFTDPMSNSGHLVPIYMLARMNETPDTFFKHYFFTYSHDKSIEAVAEKLVDGASVDSLIWDYQNSTNPGYTSKTKIIEISPPYGIPPVVIPAGSDPEFKRELEQIFLDMDKDERGREILKNIKVDKFVKINDSAYDTVREMERWESRD